MMGEKRTREKESREKRREEYGILVKERNEYREMIKERKQRETQMLTLIQLDKIEIGVGNNIE